MVTFECKIRYGRMLDSGTEKKVTETYIVEAQSYGIAEANIINEVGRFISSEYEIVGVKKTKYSEIFSTEDPAAEKWFECKMAFITLDEKSGKEKRTNNTILVQAADLHDAVKRLDDGMKGAMSDYVQLQVKETKIIEYYPYHADSL